jgi:hypothetical protein
VATNQRIQPQRLLPVARPGTESRIASVFFATAYAEGPLTLLAMLIAFHSKLVRDTETEYPPGSLEDRACLDSMLTWGKRA